MFKGFSRIVEERIRKAQTRGEFENLAGAGKPLRLEEDRHIPEELRLSHKILKNADCLPPEIELKKEIERTEDMLRDMEETAEKYRAIQKLNFMIMKLNTTRNQTIDFEIPQVYSKQLVERLENKKKNTK